MCCGALSARYLYDSARFTNVISKKPAGSRRVLGLVDPKAIWTGCYWPPRPAVTHPFCEKAGLECSRLFYEDVAILAQRSGDFGRAVGRDETMILNILDDAVKYTETGGKVKLDLAREDGAYRILVRDTGSGIPSPDPGSHLGPFLSGR